MGHHGAGAALTRGLMTWYGPSNGLHVRNGLAALPLCLVSLVRLSMDAA